jgi:hypothetical protein
MRAWRCKRIRAGRSHSPRAVILNRGRHETGWLKEGRFGGEGATTAVPFFLRFFFFRFRALLFLCMTEMAFAYYIHNLGSGFGQGSMFSLVPW